jgi:hypothetical protein
MYGQRREAVADDDGQISVVFTLRSADFGELSRVELTAEAA